MIWSRTHTHNFLHLISNRLITHNVSARIAQFDLMVVVVLKSEGEARGRGGEDEVEAMVV